MSGAFDLVAVALTVGAALAFFALRAVRSLRRRRPSCCGDGAGEPGDGHRPEACGKGEARMGACAGCALRDRCG